MPPLLQALALVDVCVDDVYVGDPAPTDHSWSRLRSFVLDDVVVVDGPAAPGGHPAVIEALAVPDRNRPDAAEAGLTRRRFRRPGQNPLQVPLGSRSVRWRAWILRLAPPFTDHAPSAL